MQTLPQPPARQTHKPGSQAHGAAKPPFRGQRLAPQWQAANARNEDEKDED